MAASGAKNAVLIVIILVALAGVAIIAGPKLLGPSAEETINEIRGKGDPFVLKMGRSFSTSADPSVFTRVTVQLQYDDEAKKPESTAKIAIGGYVKNAADKAAVEKIVNDNNPPYPVEWNLAVDAGK